MKLKLRYYPDPILKRKAKRVFQFDNNLRNIGMEMLSIMYRHDGIGLAAPQVGLLRRIIVLDPTGEKRISPIILINPEVIWQSDKMEEDSEGCLSFPGVFLQIKRPIEIMIFYQDINGERHFKKVQDLNARICCHEMEHLDSILLSDPIEEKNQWMVGNVARI